MQQPSLSGRTVCIVDDDELVRQAMGLKLREHGIAVREAATGPELYTLMAREHLDCILLDYDLASENGLFVQDQLRQKFLDVPPVIMLTAVDNQRTIIKAFRTGVNDYLLKKGLRPEELIQSLRTALMRKAEEDAAKAETERLKSQAPIDDVTGLFRREALDAMLGSLIERSGRSGKAFSVIAIRINQLEAIQVQSGQVVGKRVLAAFATRLRKVLRPTDVCGQIGPDLFACLVDTAGSPTETATLISRFAEAVTFDFRQDAANFNVTADFGVARFPGDGDTAKALLEAACAALKPGEPVDLSTLPVEATAEAVGAEPSERRRQQRQRVLKGAQIVTNAGQSVFDCTVRDLSPRGARLKLLVPFNIPESFVLRIVGAGRDQPARLAWQRGHEIGVEFPD